MDISTLDAIKTNVRKLDIEGPDGEPLTYDTGETEETGRFEDDGKTPILQPKLAKVTISLVSSDSPEYSNVYKRQVTNAVERVGKRGGKKHGITGDTVERDKLDLLVACTKAWVGWEDQGRLYEFNPDNARSLYKRVPFVKDQVDDYIHERGNF